MWIYVNGDKVDWQGEPVLAALLAYYGIDAHTRGVAVGVNRTVIARQAWPSHILQPEDKIDIVYARQGG
ncbi:MAG: sulfur carrier protein ThiS [Bacteroidia bacterium]